MNAKRWFVGLFGTWFVLTLMAESDQLEPLATALAFSIATAATFTLGPDAFGVINKSTATGGGYGIQNVRDAANKVLGSQQFGPSKSQLGAS